MLKPYCQYIMENIHYLTKNTIFMANGSTFAYA